MATAEFDPQTVTVGCSSEIQRIKAWRENRRLDYIEKQISIPRLRGPFWRREAYLLTRDEVLAHYEKDPEWGRSESWHDERAAEKWTKQMNDILALACKAYEEKSKVTLSEKEVKSIWPEA